MIAVSEHSNPEISLQKKDRAAFAGGPSQGRKRPGRAATAGAIACLVLQIKKARTLTGLNFCSRFSARFIFRRADMSDRAPANYVGRASAFRLDYLCALVPLCACFRRNAPAILIASATNRSWVSASDSPVMAVILRSNMIDAPPATSLQVKVRARIGVTSCPSIFG